MASWNARRGQPQPAPARPLVASIKDLSTSPAAIKDLSSQAPVQAATATPPRQPPRRPPRQPPRLDVGGPDASDAHLEDLRDLNVVQDYEAHLRQNPRRFMDQLLRAWNGEGWRGYTDYIGARILQPAQSAKTASQVMHSHSVQTRIQTLARTRAEVLYPQHTIDAQYDVVKRRRYQRAKDRLRRQLEQHLFDVANAQVHVSIGRLDSLSFIKVFAVTLNNILTRLYHQGIHISVPQVLELRRVAQHAADCGQSIIFLPCHKSHIDYLTVSWLLFRVGISLPAIVAGQNLDLPVVGNILRGGGAFFIRRTFAGDHLYPVVIREYIETLLAEGRNMECFIEGTRSRTGKLLPPKLGILKYIVEAMQTRRTDDVWICPVSLQYDSVIESETYVSELLGKPKEQESLFGLLSGSSSILSLKLGRIDVRFDKPWSLRQFIDGQHARRSAQIASVGGDTSAVAPLDFANNNTHKTLLLKALGYRVLADINRVSVVMPAALVGTVLLTLRGRGVGRAALERKVDWLRAAILQKGFQVADFGQMSTHDVVERALGLMRSLVDVQAGPADVMEETILPLKRFELSFYRNQVIHVFVNEALLCVALYTKVKQGGTAPMQRMTRAALLGEVAFISGVLRNEFVYGTEGAETNVDCTVAGLVRDDVLEEGAGTGTGTDAAAADTQRTVSLHPLERERGRESFDSFLFLIWPFVESYWLACCSLLLLAPPLEQLKAQREAERSEASGGGGGGSDDTSSPSPSRPTPTLWFAAKDFEKKAQLFGKTLYQQGEVAYLEAINAATLSQAFSRMEELGLILRRKSDAVKPVPLIAIAPEYVPAYEFEGEGEGAAGAGSRAGRGIGSWIGVGPARPLPASTASTASMANPAPSPGTASTPGAGSSPSGSAPTPTPTPTPTPSKGKLWDFLDHLSSFRREGKERREILLGERIMRHVVNDEYRVAEVTFGGARAGEGERGEGQRDARGRGRGSRL